MSKENGLKEMCNGAFFDRSLCYTCPMDILCHKRPVEEIRNCLTNPASYNMERMHYCYPRKWGKSI